MALVTKEKKEGLAYEIVKMLAEGKIPGYEAGDVELVRDKETVEIVRLITYCSNVYHSAKRIFENYKNLTKKKIELNVK